jgi:hypothetical protein
MVASFDQTGRPVEQQGDAPAGPVGDCEGDPVDGCREAVDGLDGTVVRMSI